MSVPNLSMQTILPTGKTAAAVWAVIQDHIRKSNHPQAVSYLRTEIQDSKIYEEHARLDKEREANFHNLLENSAEHKERSETNGKTIAVYEPMALALGKYLTTRAPNQAIAAFQLIQNVGYHIEGIPEEVYPSNENYSKAQTAIVDIYSSCLQKTFAQELRHQYLAEILRSTYNVRISSRQSPQANDLNYYKALEAFLGPEVPLPPSKDFVETKDILDNEMNLILSKIYLGIMDQIRKSIDPSNKETSEQGTQNKILSLVTSFSEAENVQSLNQHKVALLSLLEGYMDPKGMAQPKLFCNFDHAGVKTRESFLLLELPLHLGSILWGLQQKKNLASKASANQGTVNNSAVSMAASASQSNGSAILPTYTASIVMVEAASMTTSVATPASSRATTNVLPQPKAGSTEESVSNNSPK